MCRGEVGEELVKVVQAKSGGNLDLANEGVFGQAHALVQVLLLVASWAELAGQPGGKMTCSMRINCSEAFVVQQRSSVRAWTRVRQLKEQLSCGFSQT